MCLISRALRQLTGPLMAIAFGAFGYFQLCIRWKFNEMQTILNHYCGSTTDNTRDTRLPIPPRVMALSAMGLNLGVFGFLLTTHAKTNAKQMRPHSFNA